MPKVGDILLCKNVDEWDWVLSRTPDIAGPLVRVTGKVFNTMKVVRISSYFYYLQIIYEGQIMYTEIRKPLMDEGWGLYFKVIKRNKHRRKGSRSAS
jgi:hypothetical protein